MSIMYSGACYPETKNSRMHNLKKGNVLCKHLQTISITATDKFFTFPEMIQSAMKAFAEFIKDLARNSIQSNGMTLNKF